MSSRIGNALTETADKLESIHSLVAENKFVEAKSELASLAPFVAQDPSSVIAGEYYYLQAAIDINQDPPLKVLAVARKAYSLLSNTAENLTIGRTQALIGKLYVALGDLISGEAFIRDAISSFRRIDHEEELVGCYNKLAQVYFIRGEFRLADKFLSESIELLKKSEAASETALIRARGNHARIQILLGDWSSAHTTLNECVEFNQYTDGGPSLAKNLLSLGYVLYLKEEYTEARRTLDQAYDVIRRHDLLRERAIYHEYMGELLHAMGDNRMSRQHFAYALEIGNRIAPESAIISQTERRLAELEYFAGNYALALDHANRGLEVANHVGEIVETAGAKKILGALEAANEKFDEAVVLFDEAIATLELAGEQRELAWAYFMAGKALLNSCKHHKLAVRHLNSAVRIANQLPITWLKIHAHYQLSLIEIKSRNYDEALKYLVKCEELAAQFNDDRAIEECRILRLSVEDDMVDAGLSNENEYSFFSSFLTASEYGSLKAGNLEDTLKILRNKIGGHRAFIFSYDTHQHSFETLAALDFDPTALSKVAKSLANGRGGSLPLNRPLLVTHLGPDRKRMFDFLMTNAENIGAFITLPIQLSQEISGLVYIDKDDPNNAGFTKANLDFAIAFSDILAFKSSEEQKNRLVQDNRRLKDQLQKQLAFPNIITASHDVLDILDRVMQVKDSPISIQIEGETGTGKDILAKAIHYNSNRKDKRFISVNCAALPETLLESELFGYKRGAFTGAEGEKVGLFEEADGGTFFLDEIGDMPLSIQVKLLRVIEEKEVVRLGETFPRKVDVRVISATNRDLRALMELGQFRQDLYYRLSTFAFRLPPLRERREDVPLLIKHFIAKFDAEVKIEPEAFNCLADYDWPGNIRELENELKKLVLLAGEKKVISSFMISRRITEKTTADVTEHASQNGNFSLYERLNRLEREYILKALRNANWVKKHAAEQLAIPESTLRLKMKQYHLAQE
ncbi:MAG: sigma 54-interacting transcriptional regulator [Candidatus Zixiibacteriota bacterium]